MNISLRTSTLNAFYCSQIQVANNKISSNVAVIKQQLNVCIYSTCRGRFSMPRCNNDAMTRTSNSRRQETRL